VGGLPAGSIMAWGTNTPPANWLIADGSAVSRSTFSSLFAVIGTQYGAGNGTTTFNLPDLRGRVPVGRNGGTFGTLAGTGGAETHVHDSSGMTAGLNISRVGGETYIDYNDRSGATYSENRRVFWTATGTFSSTHSESSSFGVGIFGNTNSGSSLPPYLVVNYIIKATAGWTAGDSELATRVGQLELTRAPIASPSFTGNVTKASQSSFLVYSNTAYVGAGGWVNITRLPNSGGTATAAVEYNIGTNWNSTNGRYTAPLSGRYEFYVGGWASHNGAGQRYAFSFRVNGGSLMYIGGGGTTIADSPLSNYNIVLNLSANDYVELHMFSAVAMNLGGSHAIHYGGYFLG
jgi:microcystin-dependent protein